MTDWMKKGREAYEDGVEYEDPPSGLSPHERRSWKDGWIDAAAEDPESDVTWANAGYPDWN